MEKNNMNNNDISHSSQLNNNAMNDDNDGLQLLKLKNEENNNWLRKKLLKNNLKLIYLIILIIIILILEFIYRNRLFDYSVKLISNWQNESNEDSKKFFFIFITELGGQYMIGLMIITSYYFFSLMESFAFFSGAIKCIYLVNLLKIIYGNKRPFWIEPELIKYNCDGGYGNPSGHSLMSCYIYLSYYYILSKKKLFDSNLILKIVFLFCDLILVFLIMLSRIFLGMHSINQILYGFFLGFFCFYFDYLIFEFHSIELDYYIKVFKSKKIMKILILIIIICFLVIILFYFTLNKKTIKDNDNILNGIEKCQKLEKYRRLNNDALFASCLIIGLLGLYFGQMFFWKLLEKKYFEIFYNSNFEIKWVYDYKNIKKNPKVLFKIFGIFIFCLLPGLLFLTSDLFKKKLILFFIFSHCTPLFCICFLLYGPGMYFLVLKIE